MPAPNSEASSGGAIQGGCVMLPRESGASFGKRKRQRESRRPVLLRASLRAGVRDRVAYVKNVSSHGMMIEARPAPHVGQTVEIGVGRVLVIGRIVWQSGDRFGIYSRNPIDVSALLKARHDGEERHAPRPHGTASESKKPRDYRLVARSMQFAASVGFALAACTAVAILLHEILVKPMQALSAQLTP